jgi:hypothetical protein
MTCDPLKYIYTLVSPDIPLWSGRARTILAELDDNKCRDFNNLVKALRNRYGSVNRSELFKAELQGKVKGNMII